ncbi:signal peptide peptidase SppA [Olivibacter sitiensis]|uniref:signal peptide peptidase SppA n=1 Tax=Olivibacter sitiensis TaxID=376470 RepID=UPI00040E0416|nr:signal peptide peptidase SppA [Olivibacter sitiensis]
MKQFFKYVFASVVGVFISVVLIFVFFIIIVSAMISSASSDGPTVVENNSVLTMKLDYAIDERSSSTPFGALDLYNMKTKKQLGLNDISARIKAAKENENIKGILLDLSSVGANFATAKEIRDALLDFKSSKKFIVAYSEYYSQTAYYLASAADKVYLNPVGELDFRGLASQVMFYKQALDKLGIEAQVIKVGTYKSAVEPFILDGMSEANKLQVNSYLQSINNVFLDNISKSRNIAVDSLKHIADSYLARNAEGALSTKMIDGLKYKDELLAELAKRLDVNDSKSIKSLTIEDYIPESKLSRAKDRIAVIYANGSIVSGEGDHTIIGSESISKAIRKVREDKQVKAVVLRVNSPGGSALASDVIWREVELCKQQKPIIVSMGDVAASGGYYISCAADSIFAQPNTITGSIGVFGIIPNMKSLLNNKLGVHIDVVKTGKYADLGDLSRPLTAEETSLLQQEVNRTYSTFTKRVADGRKLSQAQVDSIGQGRVWTGSQAMAIGLVDKLGGLDDAIKAAASKAKLEEYKLVTYPAIKSGLEQFIASSSDDIQSYMARREFGAAYPYVLQAKEALQLNGIQARLPYSISIQ